MIGSVTTTIITVMMVRIALTHSVVAVTEFTVATVEFTLATAIMIIAAFARFRIVAIIRKRRRGLQVKIAHAMLKAETVRVRELCWRR